jgi:hypothetical protein
MARINSRQKGKRIERYFANLLKDLFPDIRRNAGTQAQSGGVDLENTPGFNFEVKGGKQTNIKKVLGWLEQVKGEGNPEYKDVILVKPDRLEPYVVMPFTVFIELIDENN